MNEERGAWNTNSDRPDMLICSKCQHGFDMWKWDQNFMNYCPNCGQPKILPEQNKQEQ